MGVVAVAHNVDNEIWMEPDLLLEEEIISFYFTHTKRDCFMCCI